MRLRPRHARIRTVNHAPVITVADYLRVSQPAEYALLCAIAGMRDNAAGDVECHWAIGAKEPLAVLDRIMRQAPRRRDGNE